jgi:excisionase family DNA binding protein
MLQLQPALHQVRDDFDHHLGRSVSIEQAAVLLGVCRRTIYSRINDGTLQTVRTLGTSQRVLVSSVDEYRKVVWAAPPLEIQPPKAAANVVPFEPRRVSY